MTKLNFTVENITPVEDDSIDKSQFSKLLVDCFSTAVSAHNTYVTEDTLRKTAKSILLKPFVFAIDKRFDDLSTHVPEEVAGGFVPHNANIDFKQMPDGSIMMSTEVLIWKRYSGDLLNYFQRDGGKKSVSVEIEVLDADEEPISGLTHIKDFVYNCITGLGDLIQPAIQNAQAILQFSEDFSKAKEEYEFASRYDELDFKIPAAMKKNAQEGLDLNKQYRRGGTSVGLASARYIVKNETASPEKVRHIAKYFPRHADDNLDDKKSNGWIAWQLWGGNAGRKWSSALVEKMDEIDSKRMSYFAEEENDMPYTSMKDVNPAIKGIEPPVSLGQANEIAKAADAIGSDKEKNGWAIAIAQFKKTHVEKDGKWVKKEKMAEEDFAKEDVGKGSAIKVDKSNDSMSDTAWGDVDKTELMHKVLNASNYKSLVHDVYLIVDEGWEEHPSQSLHYPVMQISGDKAVYNKNGLQAAFQRASAQNETAVISKVKSLYHKLGIGEDSDNKGKKEEMSMADAKEKEETPEEEKKETPEEEKKEQEEGKEFSFNYADAVDFAVMGKMFAEADDEEGDEEDKKFAEMCKMGAKEVEKGKDFADPSTMMSALYAKMCKMAKKMQKMAEDSKVYLAENEELKKKFAEQEEKQKEFEIGSFMKEFAQKVEIPQDAYDQMLEKGKTYKFADINVWKNECKAMAFDFKVKTTGKEFKRSQFPFLPETPKSNSAWDNI